MATAGGETGGEINDHLGINDLNYVISKLEEYEFPEPKWDELGLKLHISQSKLDTVGANYPLNVKACLRECLALWLRWNYNVDEYGKPSLEKLEAAVEEMGLRAVADKIGRSKKIEDFRRLVKRFEALVDKIRGHLADQVKNQKLQACEVVRVKFIKEKWKLGEGITDEVSIDELFNRIQDHYSVLNCSLIEAIVDNHVDKSSQLQEDMKVYVEEMNRFKHSLSLQDLQYTIENASVENYNSSEGSDTSCKVVMKLTGGWDKMIINDLEAFLRQYFEDEDIFNLLQITPKSVCISYLVPGSAIDHIINAFKSKSESMCRVGVFYFSINGNILLDEKDDVDFDESLIEAVKLCEVYEVSLLLSLGANPYYEDSNGGKALELAMKGGNEEIIKSITTTTDLQVIKQKSQEDLSDEKVNKETTDENEKLKVEIQRLQDSNAELKKSLVASKREIEELQSQKKESEQILKKKLNASYSEIDKLKESLAETKSTLAKSKDESLALQKKNDELKESLAETKSTLAKSKDESLALQTENDELKESLAETKSTLAKSKDESLALQKKNDELLAALTKSKEDSLISLTLQKEYDIIEFKELLMESKYSKDESQKGYEKLKELLAESKRTFAKSQDDSLVLQDKIQSLVAEVLSLRNGLEKVLFEQTEQIKAETEKIEQILQEKISSFSDRPPSIGACEDKSTQSEDVHFHNANNYKDVAHIPVSKSLLEYLTSIRLSFGSMMYQVLRCIKSLRLPWEDIKEFLFCTYESYDSKLIAKLDKCSDISGVFYVIRGECSLTNIRLLEAVFIEEFGTREKEEYWYIIERYKKTLHDLCKSLSYCLPMSCCAECDAIIFALNWKPEEHELKDIEEILAKITQHLRKPIKIVCNGSTP